MLTPIQSLLLVSLRYLREHGPEHHDSGICFNVQNVVWLDQVPVPSEAYEAAFAMDVGVEKAVYEALGEVFVELGLDPGYPIQIGDEAPDGTYDEASDDGTMWDRDTVYGRARWALLDQVINHLEQQAS